MLGGSVVRAVTQSGGFSPGVAVRVLTRGGRRAFVKVVGGSVNSVSVSLHRREAEHAAALPSWVPAPELLGVYDDSEWVALVFAEVEGRQPHVPWRAGELELVFDAVARLALGLTPAPFEAPAAERALARGFDGWRELCGADRGVVREQLGERTAGQLEEFADVASGWGEAVRGDSLAHGDLRADNMLLTRDGVVFVDWPHAMRAAPWFDLLLMLPCVRAQGGPAPEEVFRGHPVGREADPEAVTVVLAAFAGFLLRGSLKAAPPGLPTIRPFQRAQGDAALEWLRVRLS